jgi:hypothetical protein
MFHGLLGVWLALAASASAAPAASATSVIPFRTDAQPRVDPVFGDAASLRLSVDRFLALQGEMDHVRDEFLTAVHETLAALAGPPALGAPMSKACPAATAAPYARALAAGGRYLLLGQQLQGHFRDIRRADDLGDAAALTPDYRIKVKQARDLHQHLLDDYREMRVAFYDQLGAEMRHATCKTGLQATARAGAKGGDGAVKPGVTPNPTDASAWSLDEAGPLDEPHGAPSSAADKPGARTSVSEPAAASRASTMAAPAIWIDVDNTLCPQPTRVSVDGQALGEVGARKKSSVRTHAGPREICALPASDARACGDPGTVRKAYLHEGWSLTVHCER